MLKFLCGWLCHHVDEKLALILTNQEKIMATQAELAAKVKEVDDKLVKIGGESTAMLAEIKKLQDVIANGPPVTPELQAAVDALAARAQSIDDLVPDVPTL